MNGSCIKIFPIFSAKNKTLSLKRNLDIPFYQTAQAVKPMNFFSFLATNKLRTELGVLF